MNFWNLEKILKMRRRRKNYFNFVKFITYSKYLQWNVNLCSSGDIQSFCCWPNPPQPLAFIDRSWLDLPSKSIREGTLLIFGSKLDHGFLLYFVFYIFVSLAIFTKYKYCWHIVNAWMHAFTICLGGV